MKRIGSFLTFRVDYLNEKLSIICPLLLSFSE